jgi:ABC-type molybdate transport system permease subunit
VVLVGSGMLIACGDGGEEGAPTVIVPLAAPGVFTAAILTFFFAWNDCVFGISLTATNNRPAGARGVGVLHR